MPDHIDEFQSIFKGAERQKFAYVDVPIRSVTIVTDTDKETAERLKQRLPVFLTRLSDVESWRLLTRDDFSNVAGLLDCIDREQTDLIITYRHLLEESLVPQHSLGVCLDVLTQTTSIPVLVLPGTAASPITFDERVCDRVMVVADHISGDSRLINYGARLCRDSGTIWLCHIEDDRIFERYMHAIERIPAIDTSDAREMIAARLQKDAEDFLDDCMRELNAEGPNASYQAIVERGHHLREYSRLIESHNIDLLVMNTKDDDQLAMHGRAYSLAVEMTSVCILML